MTVELTKRLKHRKNLLEERLLSPLFIPNSFNPLNELGKIHGELETVKDWLDLIEVSQYDWFHFPNEEELNQQEEVNNEF